jgi:putative tricarboxylic transport membrane protein
MNGWIQRKEFGRMKRKYDQLVPQYSMALCMTIFLMLFFMAVVGRTADPGADYPNKPIDYVVHVAPGAMHDIMGRLINDIMQKEKILSQPLVVVNKQGAGGTVAASYLLERKGNPYLVLAVSTSSFLLAPLLEKLPFNYKSFTPLCNLNAEGSVLVVRSDSPFKTIDDLIAYAQKRPKELLQGGGSPTSAGGIMGRSMQKVKGVQWSFISFKGDEEALLNVLSGNVHFIFLNPSEALEYVRAGKLKILLACTLDRLTQLTDIPTMQEAGLGYTYIPYRGIVGPPNMPDYAVKKLEAAFRKVMYSDRYKKYLEDKVVQPAWMSSQEYSKFLEEENGRWRVRLPELNLLK